MKPLIGITASSLIEGPAQTDGLVRDWIFNTQDYFRAVQQAGGIPVLLPFVTTEAEAAEVLARVDGILLSGGDDVDPLRYGELPHPKLGHVNPERDATELAYAKVAMERDLPTLGICRGHQLLAVAFGGTLWQDIPTQVDGAIKHDQKGPKYHPTHPVRIHEGTRLHALLGGERLVNTRHHQSVKDVPAGWTVSALSPDGVIEAMERPDRRFAVAVQWHPESFYGRPYHFESLFEAFVAAAQPEQ